MGSQMELTPSVPFNDDILKDVNRGFDNPMYGTAAQRPPEAVAGAMATNNNDAVPSVLDPSGVTFINGHGDKGFTNPLYGDPQVSWGPRMSRMVIEPPRMLPPLILG
eukprot:GHVO01031277.1.p1 GENE.GHVO01031277.1~~GHVO01031277.1.p1  ORF type:complete len:107 (-),score=12.19 GHVO01031277.1:244-564(-)